MRASANSLLGTLRYTSTTTPFNVCTTCAASVDLAPFMLSSSRERFGKVSAPPGLPTEVLHRVFFRTGVVPVFFSARTVFLVGLLSRVLC